MTTANSSLSSPGYWWASQATLIIDSYISRTVAGIGVLFNIAFIVLLKHRVLKHKLYGFMWCRAVCNLMALALIAANIGSCMDCEYQYEWMAYYSWLNPLFLRTSTLSAFISDIFLIADRYFEINRKENFFSRLSKTRNLLISILVPNLLALPFHFAVDIVRASNGSYYKKFSEFGRSWVFIACYFVSFFVETLIPLAFHLFLNIASIFKFKRFMDRHAHLTGNETDAKKSEEKFTKMVIIISAITSITRILDLIVTIGNRTNNLAASLLSPGTQDLIKLSRSLMNLILYATFAFDASIYLKMDNNLSKLILRLTGLDKVVEFWQILFRRLIVKLIN